MAQNPVAGLFMPPTDVMPTLASLTLTDKETAAANWLAMRLFNRRPVLEQSELYYDGMQHPQLLHISVPPTLENLRTIVGWCRIGVDALVNRSIIEGFRYPGKLSVDEQIMAIWQANNLDGESMLAHLDALMYGHVYTIVGTGDMPDTPLITCESPMNMAANYDLRTHSVTAALQVYADTDYTSDMYGQEVAALYLPDRTIHLARDAQNGDPSQAAWQIYDRDDHELGFVPVARIANRQRLSRRTGSSEITATWRNTVDSACRTLTGMEVHRELYGAPKRYALGVAEDAFQKADGTRIKKWDAAMDAVWTMERDEQGELPQVGEFKSSDPTAHTNIMSQYQALMSAEMGLPPTFLGLHTQGNPASADAIRTQYEELVARAKAKHVAFGEGWEQTMRLALRVRDGSEDMDARRLETDWRDPAPQTISGTSDAILKQIQSGYLPAASDEAGRKLGYSAVARARIEQERLHDHGLSALNEIASSIEAKSVVMEGRISKAAGQPVPSTQDFNPKSAKIPLSAPADKEGNAKTTRTFKQ